ncbi:Ca-activated chloride channel family protein [Roseivirga pacifica]|uniref:Ca-activated chloride channel family protein n=2 Tax=Roseivirga pacifica TaxID=1267423 RepID=A0A1I0M7R3_9BACT|nr:Ca-activated chloride channel family protein [Roseivirga pacifica]SEV84148.1 Ca-activated chloride channel family protein [Roseivirga pacifica]
MFKDLFPVVWSDFHFLRPMFLWLFIPVAIVVVLSLFGGKEQVKWKKHIAPHLRPFMINKGSGRTRALMQGLLIFGLVLGVMGLSGPTWKRVEEPAKQLETPLVILLDLSQSMLIEDIQPSRLQRAKFKLTDFLEANPGARVGLIAFAGTAHTVVPLTRDYDIIKSHIESLSPSIMPVAGQNQREALELADSVMSVTDAPGTIVLFADDFTQDDFTLYQNYLTSHEHNMEIMPMNTPSGGEVPNPEGGEVIHSQLNTDVLSRFASLERVRVNALTLDDSDVRLIATKVQQNLKFTEKGDEKEDEWRDAGVLFIWPVALIMLLWFRRGWVVYSLVIMAFTSSCSNNGAFSDWWYTKDYQGQQAMDSGDFDTAAALFQDPLRKGVAYFKAGNYDEAIKAFNQDTSAMGAYNLGLAYYQSGDYLSAQMAFGEAAEMDPENELAKQGQEQAEHLAGTNSSADPKEAEETPEEGPENNKQNDSMEDLSGGGQEATKEDMEKERLEETVATDIMKAKELDEVPDDLGASSPQQQNFKVLLQQIDDDPALFLQKKFEYQIKKRNQKQKGNEN